MHFWAFSRALSFCACLFVFIYGLFVPWARRFELRPLLFAVLEKSLDNVHVKFIWQL